MPHKFCIAVLLSLCAISALGQNPTPRLQDAILGEWDYIDGPDGKSSGDAVLKVTRSKMSQSINGVVVLEFKYTIDAKKKPAVLYRECTKGPQGAGEKLESTIAIKDGKLFIKYDGDGSLDEEYRRKKR